MENPLGLWVTETNGIVTQHPVFTSSKHGPTAEEGPQHTDLCDNSLRESGGDPFCQSWNAHRSVGTGWARDLWTQGCEHRIDKGFRCLSVDTRYRHAT